MNGARRLVRGISVATLILTTVSIPAQAGGLHHGAARGQVYVSQAPVYQAQAPVAYSAQAPMIYTAQAPVTYAAQAPMAYTAQAPVTYTLQAPTVAQAPTVGQAPATYTIQL